MFIDVEMHNNSLRDLRLCTFFASLSMNFFHKNTRKNYSSEKLYQKIYSDDKIYSFDNL